MAWTYIGAIGGHVDGPAGTTVDTDATLNVAAGDLLVCVVSWQNSATTAAVAEVDASNSFTMATVNNQNSNIYMVMGYKIGAAADASFTGRATYGASVLYRYFVIMQFRPDAGDTVEVDTIDDAGTGASTAMLSANIDTVGDDEVVIGGAATYDNRTYSDQQIADSADDGALDEDTGAGTTRVGIWYKLFTSTQTGIHAQATNDSLSRWVCDVISFKSTAAAGGLSIPVAMHYYKMQRRVF